MFQGVDGDFTSFRCLLKLNSIAISGWILQYSSTWLRSLFILVKDKETKYN